jgi:hypothetical protein
MKRTVDAYDETQAIIARACLAEYLAQRRIYKGRAKQFRPPSWVREVTDALGRGECELALALAKGKVSR